MVPTATFALKVGLCLRRVRLDMFSSCYAAPSQQSGRESIYRTVQFSLATFSVSRAVGLDPAVSRVDQRGAVLLLLLWMRPQSRKTSHSPGFRYVGHSY